MFDDKWLGREDRTSNAGSKVPRLATGHAPVESRSGSSRHPDRRRRRCVRTAQHDQPARFTRRRICRAWSRERATPNTVGPLPDITAPSAPAASSAAFMRADRRHAPARPRASRLFVSAAATRRVPRPQRLEHPLRRRWAPPCQPAGTRPYTSPCRQREVRVHQHQRVSASRRQRASAARRARVATARPVPRKNGTSMPESARQLLQAAPGASAASTAGSAPRASRPRRSIRRPAPPPPGSACSSRIRAPASTPAAFCSSRAARTTRLPSSVGKPRIARHQRDGVGRLHGQAIEEVHRLQHRRDLVIAVAPLAQHLQGPGSPWPRCGARAPWTALGPLRQGSERYHAVRRSVNGSLGFPRLAGQSASAAPGRARVFSWGRGRPP